jgi:hypothetical protein
VSPTGEVLSSARNRVEATRDASAHAEMLCLRGAPRGPESWRLPDCTLYVTLEPCVMCLGAAQVGTTMILISSLVLGGMRIVRLSRDAGHLAFVGTLFPEGPQAVAHGRLCCDRPSLFTRHSASGGWCTARPTACWGPWRAGLASSTR